MEQAHGERRSKIRTDRPSPVTWRMSRPFVFFLRCDKWKLEYSRLARRATTRDKQDGEADGARPRHGSQRRLFLYVLMGAQFPPSHIACLTTMSHKTKCADNITSRLSNMDETLVNACRTPTILNRRSIDFLPRPKLTSRCNRIGECFAGGDSQHNLRVLLSNQCMNYSQPLYPHTSLLRVQVLGLQR
jgi:hypothetical protein